MTDDPAPSDGLVNLPRHGTNSVRQRIWASDPVKVDINLPHFSGNLLLTGATLNLRADTVDGGITLNISADKSASVSHDDWQAGEMPSDDDPDVLGGEDDG